MEHLTDLQCQILAICALGIGIGLFTLASILAIILGTIGGLGGGIGAALGRHRKS